MSVVTMWRCKTCRHWDADGEFAQLCRSTEHVARSEPVAIAEGAELVLVEPHFEGASWIMTGPEFGCVHWEAR